MEKLPKGKAWFVFGAETYEDLIAPHLLEWETPYEVVKIVTLPKIDYENFATDLLVDRQFIEDNTDLCSGGEERKCCLLVRRKGKAEGILVVPDEGRFVQSAAWFDGKS